MQMRAVALSLMHAGPRSKASRDALVIAGGNNTVGDVPIFTAGYI